jgi:hypothetical protein
MEEVGDNVVAREITKIDSNILSDESGRITNSEERESKLMNTQWK